MLTNEQQKLIKFVFEGKTNTEIAENLGYSPNTVKKKLKYIYKFYNVENRKELFLRAIDLEN
ncbi:MAG: response regulator transcription factor [Clostridium sp.]|nr:response regulator transcription factor [Clostridium sp.]